MAQLSSAITFTASGTSAEALATREGSAYKRTQLIITPITAGLRVTVTKQDVPAVLDQGIVLQQYQPYVEATDGGYTCYQGAIQIIASGAGSVSIVESFELQ